MTTTANALSARQGAPLLITFAYRLQLVTAAPDVVSGIVNSYTEKTNAVNPQAVLIQLGLMAVFSIVTIAAFALLRPNNRIVYAPKTKYYADAKSKPPDVGKGLMDWIRPLLTLKEEALFDKIGLDGVTFLRFLRFGRWTFTFIAVLVCGVLMPANIVYNVKEVPSAKRDTLSMLTIVSVGGNLLYLHVAMSYIICLLVCGMVFYHTKKMLALKLRYFRSEEYQEALFARSLMITQISAKWQSDQAVEQLLASLRVPYPTSAINIGRHVGTLPELIEQHEEAVQQLESVLTTYLRHPDKPLPKRPTARVGGFMGMGGRSVDAIELYTERIHRLELSIEAAREGIDSKRALNYGFASFTKVPYAHIVAKTLRSKRVKGAKIQLAPRPADILWKNVQMTDAERGTKRFFIGIVLAICIFFYTIPLVAVSFLSNLSALTVWVPFLNSWSQHSEFTFSAVTGVLPPALAVLLQLFLPWMIRKLSRKQGPVTRVKLDHMVMARYFAFLVISQFLIFSLIGVFFNIITQVILDVNQHLSVGEVFDYLKTVPANIQNTYVRQSNYWLTWYALRGFNSVFEIAQILNLVWIWFRKSLFGRTPREIREWTKPQHFDYSIYYANSLFMVTVGLIYAPLAPLVALFCAAAFWVSSWIFKYQLLYVCVTKIESGGRFWWMLLNRILVSLVFMQLMMVLTIGLQRGWLNSISAAPPIVLLLGFKLFMRRYKDAWTFYTPEDSEIAASREHRSDIKKNRLARRFGHPALHAPLWTPMLHANCQHLLPQVYRGRIEATTVDVAGKEQQGVNAGGIHFAAMEQNQLELSREEYLRQQEQWETGSMASTQALYSDKTGHGNGYFDGRRQQYLAPGSEKGAYAPGPYEMGDIGAGRQSQENLMRTQQWHNEQWQQQVYGNEPMPHESPYQQSEASFREDAVYQTPRSHGSYGHLPTGSVESIDMGHRGRQYSVDSQMRMQQQDPDAYPPQRMSRSAAPSYHSNPPSRRQSIEDLLDGYRTQQPRR